MKTTGPLVIALRSTGASSKTTSFLTLHGEGLIVRSAAASLTQSSPSSCLPGYPATRTRTGDSYFCFSHGRARQDCNTISNVGLYGGNTARHEQRLIFCTMLAFRLLSLRQLQEASRAEGSVPCCVGAVGPWEPRRRRTSW